MNWPAILLSLRLAATVCLLLLVIGSPLAYWIAFSARRWKFLVEAMVALPLVLPPTVLGYYMLVALGPRSPLGRLAESIFSTRLTFSFPGLVIASVLYSFPFAVQPMENAFTGCIRLAEVLDYYAATSQSRCDHRSGAEFCPHRRRIWSRADGGRQHSGCNPDDLNCDLRRGSGA